jgi:hypothetical protein
MSQDLAIQQSATRLQTSANHWTSSINITSPLRIRFPLFNPTELRHYRVTCIILLPRIKFYSSSSSSLSLVFVMYTFIARLLYWQALNWIIVDFSGFAHCFQVDSRTVSKGNPMPLSTNSSQFGFRKSCPLFDAVFWQKREISLKRRTNKQTYLFKRSRDSSVSIASGYGLDDRRVGVRVPVKR